MGDAANVIVGSAALYLAPKTTALPTLTALPIDWTGFDTVGYTDAGIEFVYTPTYKAITVDEEMSPIQYILNAEDLKINLAMAESTLKNYGYAIAGSTLVLDNPSGTSTLFFGSETSPKELVLGLEGPAPGANATRVAIAYRVRSSAAVTAKYTRADKISFAVSFTALADSTKAAGRRLAQITDFNPAGS